MEQNFQAIFLFLHYIYKIINAVHCTVAEFLAQNWILDFYNISAVKNTELNKKTLWVQGALITVYVCAQRRAFLTRFYYGFYLP